MSSDVLMFDGKVYSAADILPTLKRAALGELPTEDRDLVFDPPRWVMAFVRALKGSPLAPALEAAIQSLATTGTDPEVSLAALIVGNESVIGDSRALTDVLLHELSKGHHDNADRVVSALQSLALEGKLKYDPRLRDAALDPANAPVVNSLLLLIGAQDRAWLEANCDRLFGASEDQALERAAWAAMGLQRNDVLSFATNVRRRLDAVGHPAAAAVEASLRQRVATP